MFRKMKRTIAMTCVIAMAGFNAVPVFACTPPLNPPSVKIPYINFQPGGALEDAIDNAVKNWLKKCVLDTPTVEYASYYKNTLRYWSYGILNVKWDPIEGATSYEVCITKEDGAEKAFTTTYNSLFVSDRFDDFVANGMDGATVKVKAYGDGDKFSLWSDEYVITNNGPFY